MSRDDLQGLTACVVRLARRLSDEPRLAPELLRARRQFFGDARGPGTRPADDAAEHRFAEWFLLERESETLGAVPSTVPPYAELAAELAGSLVGVFLVQSGGPTVTARDLQDDAVLELADQRGLGAGDLIVGRLFPVSGERWAPSVAAPVLRPGREVATAFAHDLERLGLDRRLQQIELEHLLLRGRAGSEPDAAPPAPPLEHLEADLERLLVEVGERHSATAISQQLAAAERPGPLLGPLLDQLAFDTDVDLERARQLLLAIWNAHHAGAGPSTEDPAAPSSGPPGETLGERLVRTLDEGLEQKRDVAELFAQLERMAGIDDDDADDAAEDDEDAESGVGGPHPAGEADDGDLGPLVTEYLWESGRDQEGDGPLRLWVELQQNAPVPRTDVEAIAASDLMRLLLHVYLRATPGSRARDVRAAFDELRRFYDWVAATQEIDRRDALQRCKGSLLEQLDRLQAAGEALTTDERPERPPGLLQVEDTGADGFGARDDDGGAHWLAAGARALANLRVGDLVLGGLAGAPSGRRLAGLVVVLPIDARSLIE